MNFKRGVMVNRVLGYVVLKLAVICYIKTQNFGTKTKNGERPQYFWKTFSAMSAGFENYLRAYYFTFGIMLFPIPRVQKIKVRFEEVEKRSGVKVIFLLKQI